jgi:hypothetical protein
MLNMGFIDEVETIIKELPLNRVKMVFSATLPKDVENLCYRYMKNPINIEIAATGITTRKGFTITRSPLTSIRDYRILGMYNQWAKKYWPLLPPIP